MTKKVIIIGGGIAGLQAAKTLRERGIEPLIVEKEARLGGKLNRWHHLFPDFTPATELLASLPKDFETVNGEVAAVDDTGVTLADGQRLDADAIIIATGLDLFPAERKEEYGYGIYPNVVTTADIEQMLCENSLPSSAPRRIAFLHCVGSRDEKVGQRHCSKVCCITAIKQAMELRKHFPEAEIFNFYMDIRMFGHGYEELYRRAQEESHIQFIRGRISEASPTLDNRLQIKAEDTLLGRPMRMTVDLLVLAIGQLLPTYFNIAPTSPFATHTTPIPNIFIASANPATIPETLAHATMAATQACQFLLPFIKENKKNGIHGFWI